MSPDSSKYHHLVKEHSERKEWDEPHKRLNPLRSKTNNAGERPSNINIKYPIWSIWFASRVSIRHIVGKFLKIQVQTASPCVQDLSMLYTLSCIQNILDQLPTPQDHEITSDSLRSKIYSISIDYRILKVEQQSPSRSSLHPWDLLSKCRWEVHSLAFWCWRVCCCLGMEAQKSLQTARDWGLLGEWVECIDKLQLPDLTSATRPWSIRRVGIANNAWSQSWAISTRSAHPVYKRCCWRYPVIHSASNDKFLYKQYLLYIYIPLEPGTPKSLVSPGCSVKSRFLPSQR